MDGDNPRRANTMQSSGSVGDIKLRSTNASSLFLRRASKQVSRLREARLTCLATRFLRSAGVNVDGQA